MNIKVDDISVSHRTGKFKENKTRQIIARFPKHDLKVEILKSAKKLREIPGLQDICFNQDLTKTRDEIAFKARAYVRNHRLKATWVVDGKVMIIGKDNKKHAVTRMYDLNDYVFQSDNFTEIFTRLKTIKKQKCSTRRMVMTGSANNQLVTFLFNFIRVLFVTYT